jgi:hypothetical protein
VATIVDTSNGEARLFYVVLAEVAEQPFDLDQVSVSLTPIPTGDHTWQAPDVGVQVNAFTVRAGLLVDARFGPGSYRLYARVVDAPETVFEPAAEGRIEVQ